MLKHLVALLILACLPAGAQATADNFVPSGRPADTLTVSLVSFQPGTEYWQRFGHNALLLREASTGVAVTYNYGLFDFRAKNFFLNFARGYMVYRVAPNDLANDLRNYQQEGRWAIEQKLNLSADQRGWLRDYLEWNARAENAEYRYDYFLSNCSTRVRDAIDQALGGALRKQVEGRATGYSYRLEALRLISPDRPLMIGMDAALGPTADKPIDLWQQSFAPMSLMRAVSSAKIMDANGIEQPLVAAETELLPAGALVDPPALPPDLRIPFFFAGVGLSALLAVLAIQRRQFAARFAFASLASAFSLISGIAGLILVAIWTLTEHWAGWRNENLLLLSPLCLLLIPAWLSAFRERWHPGRFSVIATRAIAIAATLALLLRLLPGAVQDNLHWALLLWPVHAVLAWSLGRQRRAMSDRL